ncbi:MAG: 1-acyl-sn-glycerol-3-phosphate acyltransferase [bacterium]
MDDYRDLTHKDFLNRNARDYVRDRILRSDAGIKEGEYDIFGADVEAASDILAVFLFFYKYYFRVDTQGLENLPDEGPGLIIANHAPILPFDASMIYIAGLVEKEKPRFIRTITNKGISSIPFASSALSRCGQIIGCDENMRRLFENNNLVLVFPTGAEGDVHTIFNKYHVSEFTLGFMEYALRYHAPIIPTIVTGSEEAAMTLGKIDLNFAGFKHFPITPIFPWFGLLGLIPFPSQFHIRFGEPADYFTEHSADVDNPEIVKELVSKLHGIIVSMLADALGR